MHNTGIILDWISRLTKIYKINGKFSLKVDRLRKHCLQIKNASEKRFYWKTRVLEKCSKGKQRWTKYCCDVDRLEMETGRPGRAELFRPAGGTGQKRAENGSQK